MRTCNFRVFGIDYGENISIGMQDFDFYCSWARLDDYWTTKNAMKWCRNFLLQKILKVQHSFGMVHLIFEIGILDLCRFTNVFTYPKLTFFLGRLSCKSTRTYERHFLLFKGQLISKWFLRSSISSKQQTSEFDFTIMIPQVNLFLFIFWRKSTTSKNLFEINWPLVIEET